MQEDEKPDDLITASEVAHIWNQRAHMMGYSKKYTRRSVNARRTYRGKHAHILIPAQVTPLGNLYRREDAWTIPIRPDLGRKTQGNEDTQKMKAIKPAA